jgi:hypothetical protein
MGDRMTWQWTYLAVDGVQLGVPPSGAGLFPSQSEAESWLGETWEALLAEGVEAVSLLDGERVVYGPMGLRPAKP